MDSRQQIEELKRRMSRSIIGQEHIVDRLVIGLLANGNLLVEGLPGLAKMRVGMAGPRTALGDAIGLAVSLFERSETPERVLILLTDGNDSSSLMPPDRAATIARDKGVTIHAIGVGDPASVGEEKFDEAALKEIAASTGGSYYHDDGREELDAIYRELDALNPRQVETVSHRPWRELFQWPLGAALVLTLLFHALMLLRDRQRRRRLRPPSAEDGSGNLPGTAAVVMLFLLAALPMLAEPALAAPAGAWSRFHFLRPLWLWALAPAGLLLWGLLRRGDARLAWRGVIAPHLLPYLLVEQEATRSKWRPEYLLGLGWLVAILAMAGPTWRHVAAPFADDQASAAIVLKVTPSMLARDIQPSRLERSVQKIHDLLSLRPGARTALVAYSGSAHQVMPLTRAAGEGGPSGRWAGPAGKETPPRRMTRCSFGCGAGGTGTRPPNCFSAIQSLHLRRRWKGCSRP